MAGTTRSTRRHRCSTGSSRAGSGLPTTNAGIFEYYRQLAEEVCGRQARRERRVRLRVPEGIGRMNMLHLNVAADGTCEMTEEEAEAFCAPGGSGWRPATHPPSRPATRRLSAPNRYR